MTQHIIPLNDLKEHEQETTCHCEPSVIWESGNMIVVHNSFDGREGIEWTEDLLNNKSNK
jgi:hypothetical protein